MSSRKKIETETFSCVGADGKPHFARAPKGDYETLENGDRICEPCVDRLLNAPRWAGQPNAERSEFARRARHGDIEDD